LDSHQTGQEVPAAWFSGDDLLAVAQRPRGLPIGNLTSQLWGNFYLDELDQRSTPPPTCRRARREDNEPRWPRKAH
jgi:hypothetical protein